MVICHLCLFFFFFNDTATTEIYTLSLHDALPICRRALRRWMPVPSRRRLPHAQPPRRPRTGPRPTDRKSTRLNSSHGYISYAGFCLKKKKKNIHPHPTTDHHLATISNAVTLQRVL